MQGTPSDDYARKLDELDRLLNDPDVAPSSSPRSRAALAPINGTVVELSGLDIEWR